MSSECFANVCFDRQPHITINRFTFVFQEIMTGPVHFMCAILIAYIPNYGFSNFMQLPQNVNYTHLTDHSVYLFGLQQDMGLKLLNAALKESPNENIILSPHSVFHSFLILYFVINDMSRELTLRRFFDILPALVWVMRSRDILFTTQMRSCLDLQNLCDKGCDSTNCHDSSC